MPTFTGPVPPWEPQGYPRPPRNAKPSAVWWCFTTVRGFDAAGRSARRQARGDRRKGAKAPLRASSHAVHGGQELLVGLGLLELVEQELHGLDRVELREGLAKQPDLLELVLLE